jgi:hypothetical protein
LSSVLTVTGPQATYGTAEGRLNRFSAGLHQRNYLRFIAVIMVRVPTAGICPFLD